MSTTKDAPYSFVQLLELTKYKVQCELTAEATRTYLGVLWWIIEPLLFMSIYYVIFGVVLQRGTEDFVVYLIIGIVFFQWFLNTVQQTQSSILTNKGLMRQIPINKSIFPLTAIIKSAFKFIIGIIILAILLAAFGFGPTINYIYLPVLIIVELLMIVGVSLILAAIVPFLPDLANLVGHCMRILLYSSGIFYTTDFIPERYVHIFFLNPMAMLLHSYRNVLMYHSPPEFPIHLVVTAIASLMLTATGLLLIRRFNPIYVKRIYK